MPGDDAAPSRLVNFVSEEQLAEVKRTRGERVEDGTAQRDRPLYEILKENKDKQDAEFNERFKHRPPKALDEDETEFLEKLETSQKEYERKLADEEALELQRFQAAVAEKSMLVHELKEEPASVPYIQEPKGKRTKNQLSGMVIKVIPQAKKAKLNSSISENKSEDGCQIPAREVLPQVNATSGGGEVLPLVSASGGSAVDKAEKPADKFKTCLVSYSDESDED